MIAAVKRQLLAQREDLGVMVFLILGGSVFGMLLFQFINFVAPEETNGYVPLATILGAAMAVMYLGISAMTSLGLYFNLQVGMGSTRKRFFVSYLTTAFVADLISTAAVLAISAAETALAGFFMPTLTHEIKLFPYLVRWALPAAAGVSMIGSLMGVLMLRFGKKAFWAIWGIWMFLCLIFPRIMEAAEEAPDSVFGRIGAVLVRCIKCVPVHSWIVAAAAACVISLAVSWILLRKQQVTA